jgi:prepilin-type N-terminal cleavage/methylation domain-containing protein
MNMRRDSAYTLVELLIVVAILAVTAVVALPAAQPVTEFRADAAAGEVAHALRFARENAQHSGEQRLFDCNAPANTIAVLALTTSKTTTVTAGMVNHPSSGAPYRLTLNAAPAGNNMALVRCTFTYTDNATVASVAFDATGKPVRGLGSGDTRDKTLRSGQIVLGAGHVVRKVDIDASGRITVS